MPERKNGYVLDSFALLAYLQGVPAGRRVLELLRDAENDAASLFLSTINLGEIAYIIERGSSLPNAQRALAIIDNLPISQMEPGRDRILRAAQYKARFRMSFADCFGVALAEELNATLVTGDPEFAQVESIIRVEWLRGE